MIEYSEDKIAKIADKHQLADVYLFGSKITEYEHPESDLDIAIRFEESKLPEKSKRMVIYGDIFADFDLEFKGEKVDLVFLGELPPHIQFKVVTKGELIYTANLEDSLNFKERVINKYRDFRYFLDEYYDGALKNKSK